jgi:uncharacterized SAM-binding protein YcdF (DUF218 family)
MFFILSKTVAFLLLPSNLLSLAGLVGLALMATRCRRAGFRIAAASLVLLLMLAVLPVGYLLANKLENRFPRWDAARGAPAGIIILGGAISPEISADRGEPEIVSAGMRTITIAKLAKQFPQVRIIYSGGNASLIPGQPPEADFVGPLLDDMGVSRDRVTLETRSRNTAENATFSYEIAKPKLGERWLLVTSAAHMPRAMGCFRRAGFTVEAYPVDWRTLTHPGFPITLAPAENLVRTDQAVHEWIGLVSYWLSGRTSEFLPAH